MSRARGMVALVFVAAAACGGEDFQSGDGASGGASSFSAGGAATASAAGGSTSSGQGAAGGGDAECPSGSACVPVAPEGWEPVAVHVGPQPLDECPPPWTDKTTGNVGEPEPSHTCSSCACGAAANVKCSFPTIEVYTGGCSSTFGDPIVTTLTSEACKPVGGGYNSEITIITPSGGACPSSGGLPSKSDPTWPAVATLCAPASAPTACSTGVCSPVDEPFGATVCIQQEGNVACPDAFTDRVVAFRGFMDDRACQQCGCSSPAGASCDGKLTIYSSQNCTGPSYVPPNDGVCHLFDYTSAVKFDSDATGGACTATGGAPKGGIHNAEPVTVCCRPLE